MRQVQRWSYSGKPAHSAKDGVRFLVGDVDPEDKQLDDSEIEFVLTQDGSLYEAAIQCCVTLAAYYARRYDESTGKTTSGKGSLSQHYLDLAKRLREQRDRRCVPMWAGGQSIAGKEAQETDTDRVKPAFTVKTDDAPLSRLDPISKTTGPE